MTTGTKIFLAVFAAFIGVLVVYYGVLLPEAQTLPELTATTRDAGKPIAPTASTADSNPDVDMTADWAPASGITSDGGFRFDLPTKPEQPEPVQHAATDPLTGQPPPSNGTAVQPVPVEPTPAQPAATVQPPPVETQPNVPVVSGPVANQPVSLPGSIKKSSAANPTTVIPPPPPTSDYIVKSGDTMSSIAEDWFGDPNKWSLIAKENPNIDPARLSVGQKLRLPSKDAKPATTATVVKEPTPSSPSGASTYTVRSGDTLAKIAREQLGDVAKWKAIYDANKRAIGSDPAALKPGMKLKLPPKS